MILYRTGDIFAHKAQAYVNPVNCVGVMGKGLALQFKSRYPDMFHHYQDACRKGLVTPSRPLVYTRAGQSNCDSSSHAHPEFIISLATKRHWRDKSKISDITEGLQALAQEIQNRSIKTIAIPAIGAGLGGLPWPQVRQAINDCLSHLTETGITVFEPR